MGKIRLIQSSSTHLAAFFSVLIGLTIVLIIGDIIALANAGGDDEVQLMHLWVKLALLVLVCLGLFIIGFYVTKRINTICEVAEDIIRSGDLSRRIPVQNKWDDLSTLSHMLNMLLCEIEQLMQAVRQVSDNIAHDLRHPLARLRNDLEDTRAAIAREDDAQLDVRMQRLLEESDQLMNTFSALLRIGNIEGGKRHSGFGDVRLATIMQDITDLYEPLAMDRRQHLFLEVDEDLRLHGDKDLLFQALANCVDNAIKYTPEQGEIRVQLYQKDKQIHICVSDNGPGVEEEHKENLFRRFYRADVCRQTPGTGLGLSLVSAVVKLHKGTVALEDTDPHGLTICMRFPQS